ncbi:TRAP transporter small permease [Pusillimonas caeni]|uniref:TRAP transporter small permease n=1 Tax=Pusillimonas caeni TaxID=1348472 RepID=UPI000E59C401|nr:TRAP transporter small permease [Pusillimonas caeni]TFL14770.1 TRAP transporter small permease [Pusillimonas caeni]
MNNRTETGLPHVLTSGAIRALAFIAGAVLFLLMLATFADVVGRYFFNHPLLGTYELTQLALALIIFSALPWVTWKSEHVEIDFVYTRLSPRGKKVNRICVDLLVIGIFVLVGYAVILQGIKAQASGLVTEDLGIELYGAIFYMALCCLMSGLMVVQKLIKDATHD